jgi:hypothetical protein
MSRILHLIGLLISLTLVGSALFAPVADAEPVCNQSVDLAPTTRALKHAVALQSGGAANPMNMGGLRGTGETDITVTASPALPETVKPQDIAIDVPQRFARTGAGLSTSYLPEPTFSLPRILEHGKLVAFTLCVNANQIGAGTYVGQVIVGGPVGVQPATIAITLNAKDETEFIVGLIGAVIVAFALMLMRGMKLNHVQVDGDQRTFPEALQVTLKEYMGFWGATIIGIGAAVAAMLQVYDSNVSWGADSISSLLALMGTAISAAGVGTFISSLRGS